MYSQKNLIYIVTILECIEKCWIYSKSYTSPEDFIFGNEQRDFNATLMMFSAIGEESKKIEQKLKDVVETNIKWRDVAGIRNKISHDYRGIDANILWNTINNELYQLKDAILQMLDILNPEKKFLMEILDTPYYKNIRYIL